MDSSQIYAIVIGSTFGLLLLINCLPLIARILRIVPPLVSKYLIYRNVLHRHRFVGPWSRAGVLAQLLYITGNMCCLKFWNTSASEAGLQAGTLAVVNLIPAFAGPHLSNLADLLGLNLSTFRQIHRSAGAMVAGLTLFHVFTMMAWRPSFLLKLPHNLFAVIGASSLGCLILLCLSPLRKFSYELFLRTHHALAVLCVYSIWRHLPSRGAFPHVYVYISAGLFLFMCVVQGYIVFQRNGLFRYSRARAQISDAAGAVRVRIQLQKPLAIKAGQAIDLWIPSVSFWSFLQSHPFVVISWGEKPQEHLDLFIEPRRGLTRELLYQAKNLHAVNPLVLISGPHGKSISMDDSENILMIAGDFGIAAHLPYLKQLIQGYNSRKVRARRIHLVWQVQDINVIVAAQPLLNGALNEDTLDDGWILAISIYCDSSKIDPTSFGKRAKIYPGQAPLREIVQAEVSGKYIEKKPVDDVDWHTNILVEGDLEYGGQTGVAGPLLVTVSATNEVRDELQGVVRDYLTDGVSFFELDYQPSQE